MKKDWAKLAYPKSSPQRDAKKSSREEADWRSMWKKRAEDYWEAFDKSMELDLPVGMSVYQIVSDDELLDDDD